MKRLLILAVFIAAAVFNTAAQTATTDTLRMSFRQSVDYALKNQVAVKNASLDAEISHRKSQEYTGIALPQISGKFDFADYLKLPTSLIPAEFFGGEPGTYQAIQFGTQYNGTASLNASQLVFDGRYFLGIKASKTLAELSTKNVTRTTIETAQSVMKAYLTALVTNARYQQLEDNVASLKKTLDNTKALYESGFVEKVDVDRIAVGYNNLLVEMEKMEKYRTVSKYLLKFQMGMNVNQEIVLTDTLFEADFQQILQNAAMPDANNRVEYQMLQTSKSLAEMNIKQYQLGYLPSLYAVGGYSFQAQVNQFDLLPSSEWYNTAFIGFSFNLPIFDGLQKARQIQQGKLELMKRDNNLVNFQNSMNLEVANAKSNLENAISTLETQRSNQELANEIVTISRKKFEMGVGSSLEVTDAETSLKESQNNYLSALYDAWAARIDLEVALGTLAKNYLP
ncbi:MAG: TolC family protein [Chitinophagaceae bacterium]|nr:TolC family protein [Chitinophagaceae bacterium]